MLGRLLGIVNERGAGGGGDGAHAFLGVRGEFFGAFGSVLPKCEACRGAAGAGASVRLTFRMREEDEEEGR